MHFLQPSILSYAFSHFEFHFGSTAGTVLGAEHSIDGVKAAMEMHAVFYKNELTLAQETAAAAAAVASSRPAALLVTACCVTPPSCSMVPEGDRAIFIFFPFTCWPAA